ncbi:helix-turn-helix domain-containing protein [Actinoplanes friuliensis]|uniref:Putative AraC-family transcriptional regulator n=1 Tax=Actinoplanes friuliensis DSM 7358 TaxID=1246995 RepID=U5VVQ0_9ACTN|nr:AraC family transcriptional regulator [Actinoplanes friuliensis]AGZ39795.1 putative AraC-family transcriptional regulator [Actinoplanes friuliensis DSM 7358]
MLSHTALLDTPDLRIATVRCSGPPRWGPEEEVGVSSVVLVRRGVFTRRADGRVVVADALQGYLQRPGEVQQVAHPAGGDTCTSIRVTPETADRLAWAGPLHVPPAADLAHRRLLAAAGSTPADLLDLASDLIGRLLPAPRSHPAVGEARAALNADPGARLDDLAELAGCSRWHLSRTFHQVTGLTINAYRLRLRVRRALDQLGQSSSLAALAADTGFADQPHLTRAVRRELGLPPGAVRALLAEPLGTTKAQVV